MLKMKQAISIELIKTTTTSYDNCTAAINKTNKSKKTKKKKNKSWKMKNKQNEKKEKKNVKWKRNYSYFKEFQH